MRAHALGGQTVGDENIGVLVVPAVAYPEIHRPCAARAEQQIQVRLVVALEHGDWSHISSKGAQAPVSGCEIFERYPGIVLDDDSTAAEKKLPHF